MSRGRFVLFYNMSNDPSLAVTYDRDSDSLLAAAVAGCRTNIAQAIGGRALRVESDGRIVLDEATLTEITERALVLEKATLDRNRFLPQVDLSEVVFRVMLEMGLIDERGEPVTPNDDPGQPHAA